MKIDGSTIHLRDIVLGDLQTFRYWQQPGHAWLRLDGPYYAAQSAESIDKLIATVEQRIRSNSWPTRRTRLFIADAATDQLLGTVSRYWISEETNWSALGIAIYDPAYWRRGIGYEALGLWSEYLFNAFPHWVRLDLRTWSGNHGMLALASKLGFQEEARFRKARIVEGRYYDGLGFGILREEWEAQFAEGFAASLAAR